MVRILLIRNARASNASAARAQMVLARLAARGAQTDYISAASLPALDAALASRAAQGVMFDIVAVMGGDGSVRALAERWPIAETPLEPRHSVTDRDQPSAPLWAQAPRALGVIAAGGANYVAQELALPRSATDAADLLLDGTVRFISLGRVSGPDRRPSVFVLMAGVGVDGYAAALPLQALKHVQPHAAYAAAVAGGGVRHFWRMLRQRPLLTIRVDGAAHAASWAMVTNARFRPSLFRVDADTRSPRLHAVLANPRTPAALGAVLARLAVGRLPAPQGHSPRMTARHGLRVMACQHVEIASPSGLPLHADGEAAGRTPVRLEAWRTLPILTSGARGREHAGR